MNPLKQLTGAGIATLAATCIPAFAAPDLTLLNQAMETLQVAEVSPAPVDGLYEFNVGSDVLFLSEDGRYLLRGDLYDLKNRESITEKNRAKARIDMLHSVKQDDMIIFPATGGKNKHAVYIFTDIDCGYCRMLHDNVEDYNELGIEIRYLSFPRTGIGSESYDKAVAVWCAKDRNEALTKAKSGGTVESENCAAPVRDQYNMGVNIGINGTPAIILEDGTLIPGFVKPDNLAEILNQLS